MDDDARGPAGRRRVPCVGAVVHDEQGRILLVRRANPPAAGLWSVPGGRVEPGEDGERAVVREVAEETGLDVVPAGLVGTVLRDAPDGSVYVIDDFACRVTGGTLRAGDDAADVAWFDAAALATLPTSPGLVDALAEWGVLPHCPLLRQTRSRHGFPAVDDLGIVIGAPPRGRPRTKASVRPAVIPL